jgi:hypothetical protein
MKRVFIYLAVGVAALFLVAVAHYSLKEASYDLGSADPQPVNLNISQQVGSYVSVKGSVVESGVSHVGHEGIDMYFYPINGYGKHVFVVAEGNPLSKDMMSGKTAITGELKELSRIPFARSVYKDLGIKPGVDYYAVKAGKTPNPKLIYTYISLLLIGGLFFIPLIIELKKVRRGTGVMIEACV